jgi:hypothetical protein
MDDEEQRDAMESGTTAQVVEARRSRPEVEDLEELLKDDDAAEGKLLILEPELGYAAG